MKFSERQMRALGEICETFAPREDGWPSAGEIGVAGAIAEALPDPKITGRPEQLLQLLDIWDSRWHGLLAIGRMTAFSAMAEEERIRVLLRWADSSLAARALRVAVPERDLELTADGCVVGSGAGGGTAAAVLAAAGKDVIVLEAGGYYDDADFDGAELKGFFNLYAERGFASTANRSVGLLAGECVGGGTVVNYCTSFRTPREVRSEWAAAGVPWFASEEYTRSLDAVCGRLHVNLEHNRVSAREAVLERGLRALGWHVDTMPRNVIGCDQGKVCGYCGLGCAIGAKQSTAKTWLVDAQNCGARIFAETRAMRVRIEAGTATGVEAVTKDGHRVTVRCKAVVVACGAIHTPALLLRSGLRNEHIGRHLHLHPVSNVCGVFEEEIRPWEGTMQAIYSDEHCRLTGNYGVKYETTALQPVIAVAVLPWRG